MRLDLPEKNIKNERNFIDKLIVDKIELRDSDLKVYEPPELTTYEPVATQKHMTAMTRDVISATFHFHYRK